MKLRTISLALLPMAALLTSCDVDDVASWGNSDRYREDFHYSYPVKSGSNVSLESFNGSIEISSWEKDEVEVNGTKYAASEDLLKQIKVEGENQNGTLRFRVSRPEGRWGNGGAKLVVRVPKKVTLPSVNSSNGGIRIESIDGAIRARSSNGGIRVRSIHGALNLETSNGTIEANSVEGDLDAHTSNGAVRVEGLRGGFTARTSNGSINARIDAPADGKPIKVRSSNGGIDLALPGYKNQEIEAESSNSSITVRLPASASAELRASTSNSSINSEFPVASSGGTSKHRLEGKLGQGGSTIRLGTSNGSIRIQKL